MKLIPGIAAAGIFAVLPLAAAEAQSPYPAKPIAIIVPFAAGGDSDIAARTLGQHATKYLNNQPLVAWNRVGASGAIGSMAAKNATPDGYTLLVARIASHAILPAIDKWIDVLGKLASDPDWLAGNAKVGGIPAIRSPAETMKFVREQYELYERLGTSLGIRE